MTRTVEIQLLPGETEVHVTIKTAATAEAPKRANHVSEAQKVAALRAIDITGLLRTLCGKELSMARSLTTRLQRPIGRPVEAFTTDSAVGRRVICDYLNKRKPGHELPEEMIELIQQNLDLLAGHADVLCSYELAAEVTRLKAVFVTGYNAKKGREAV